MLSEKKATKLSVYVLYYLCWWTLVQSDKARLYYETYAYLKSTSKYNNQLCDHLTF